MGISTIGSLIAAIPAVGKRPMSITMASRVLKIRLQRLCFMVVTSFTLPVSAFRRFRPEMPLYRYQGHPVQGIRGQSERRICYLPARRG